jgi:hypothetical protein
VEVSNLDIVRVLTGPSKSHSVLALDPNLPDIGAAEFLELIPRRYREIVDARRRVDLDEFAKRGACVGGERFDALRVLNNASASLSLNDAITHTAYNRVTLTAIR